MASRASSKSKTLMEIFHPQPQQSATAAKRLKSSSLGFSESKHTNPIHCQSISSSLNKLDGVPNHSESSLTDQQISRMEFHKLLAKAKRNQKTCSERVSKSKGGDF